MKNPTMPNNPDTRRHKGWNRLEAPWHAALVGMDKIKHGELALPLLPKNTGGIQGTKLIMFLLWTWTVYLVGFNHLRLLTQPMTLAISSNFTLTLLQTATGTGHMTVTRRWLPWLQSLKKSSKRTVATETLSRTVSRRRLALEIKPQGQGPNVESSRRTESTRQSPVQNTSGVPITATRMNPADSLACTCRSPTTTPNGSGRRRRSWSIGKPR